MRKDKYYGQYTPMNMGAPIEEKKKMTLNERVFRKMGAGWKKYDHPDEPLDYQCWVLNGETISPYTRHDDERWRARQLPPISSSWEVCAKYLVPFMREKGFWYSIYNTHFWWMCENEKHIQAEIIDHKISEAACKAFMEVEL